MGRAPRAASLTVRPGGAGAGITTPAILARRTFWTDGLISARAATRVHDSLALHIVSRASASGHRRARTSLTAHRPCCDDVKRHSDFLFARRASTRPRAAA